MNQWTRRQDSNHKPFGLFDVIEAGIHGSIQNISFNEVVGGHKRFLNCIVIQQIDTRKGYIGGCDHGISIIDDVRNTSVNRQIIFQHIWEIIWRTVKGDVSLTGFSLIIKGRGSNICKISVFFFLAFTKIESRTEQGGLLCTLKDTVPVGTTSFAHRWKIIFRKIITEKSYRLRWKIHIDL